MTDSCWDPYLRTPTFSLYYQYGVVVDLDTSHHSHEPELQAFKNLRFSFDHRLGDYDPFFLLDVVVLDILEDTAIRTDTSKLVDVPVVEGYHQATDCREVTIRHSVPEVLLNIVSFEGLLCVLDVAAAGTGVNEPVHQTNSMRSSAEVHVVELVHLTSLEVVAVGLGKIPTLTLR